MATGGETNAICYNEMLTNRGRPITTSAGDADELGLGNKKTLDTDMLLVMKEELRQLLGENQ